METPNSLKSSSIKKYFSYIHIIIEILCFLILLIYIIRSFKNMQNQISDLTIIIQQQQKILHEHSKLMNSIFLSNEIPLPISIETPHPHPHPHPSPSPPPSSPSFQPPLVNTFANLFTMPLKKSENQTIIDESNTIKTESENENENENENEKKEVDIEIEKEIEEELNELKIEEEKKK
jgi:hypothetical protein